MAVGSAYWASVRVICGTIAGGILGFYVMHRVEISYKVNFLLSPSLFVCFLRNRCKVLKFLSFISSLKIFLFEIFEWN